MSYSLLALPCDCVVVTMSVKEFDALMNAADDVADVYGEVTTLDLFEGNVPPAISREEYDQKMARAATEAKETNERAVILRELANQYFEIGQRDD